MQENSDFNSNQIFTASKFCSCNSRRMDGIYKTINEKGMNLPPTTWLFTSTTCQINRQPFGPHKNNCFTEIYSPSWSGHFLLSYHQNTYTSLETYVYMLQWHWNAYTVQWRWITHWKLIIFLLRASSFLWAYFKIKIFWGGVTYIVVILLKNCLSDPSSLWPRLQKRKWEGQEVKNVYKKWK